MLTSPKQASILIVEDDRIDVLNIMRSFKRQNITNVVHLAADGHEAMKLLLNTQWDDDNPCPNIVLLDINMPRMNGFEFLEAIKATPDLKYLDVYILTSSNSDKDLLQAFNYNISGFITKPFSSEKLDDTLQAISQYWDVSKRPQVVINETQQSWEVQNQQQRQSILFDPNIALLIVDDDQIDQLYIKRSFKQLGLKNPIYTAKNGVDAINTLKHYGWNEFNKRPHVVLLDINMPLMNGHEFLHILRGDEQLKNTPVFAMSTSDSVEDVQRCMEYDVSAYLTKPIDMYALIKAINELELDL